MMIRDQLRGAFVAAILACAAVSSAGHAEALLPFADDLGEVAKRAHEQRVPILIAFTQASCAYCARLKTNYLVPLARNPAWRSRAIVREVDIDSTEHLRDFAGRATTGHDFARKHHVELVPTLIVFDSAGKALAAPLVGLTSEDFYGFYLERLIEAGAKAVQGVRE
jgi:thioredoxin-related protein